ncbi:MAG TPA: PepSY domain-containing protein [Candidatus Bacteroides merdipullorum]|uniref:PepSY domain-containing protein n=1 Tax=Candidatus Bacteroides merdipullorum TaxID=2838474 RepID=A0A9D2A3X4_9BACE|nr:PepSY domain-containing protein [Candidatus Bacteroides merdipullorum]
MRRLFRKIHLWLSVPFGIVITLICFSGAMLVFEKEMAEWTNPGLYRVEHPSGQPLSVGEVVARVAAILPDDVEVAGVTVFSDPGRTWQVSLTKPRRASVYVCPYTGEIKGQYERAPFFRTMFSLHRWLLGSRPSDGGIFWGKTIVGVSTLLFVVVLLTGIVIWWPRTKKALRNSLKIVFRRGWPRFWHGLHVAGGMYALLLLLVMALTGLTWSFGWYRTGFYALFGVEMQARSGHAGAKAQEEKQAKETGKARKTSADFTHWQYVYEQLATENPAYRQITINANQTATIPASVFGNTRSMDRYDFDATGKITGFTVYHDQPVSGKMRGWIYSLHVGTWGGMLMRIFYFLAALLGATLPLTGYYLWIRRLVRKTH